MDNVILAITVSDWLSVSQSESWISEDFGERLLVEASYWRMRSSKYCEMTTFNRVFFLTNSMPPQLNGTTLGRQGNISGSNPCTVGLFYLQNILLLNLNS